jgi:hypothetical protein
VTWNPQQPPFGRRLVVIGGQCNKVGKTALAADLIRAFSDLRWTAVKITPYARSGCPLNGSSCACGPDLHTFAIREEQDGPGKADTSRFLSAGAHRALWVETKEGRVADSLDALAATLETSAPVVIESNAIVHFWRPRLFLMVLDPRNRDFKRSALDALAFVDAFVFRSPVSACDGQESVWRKIRQKQTFVQLLGESLPRDLQKLAEQHIRDARHPIPKP